MNDFYNLLFEEVNKKKDGLIKDFMEKNNNVVIPFWEYFDNSNNSILSKTIFNEMYNDFYYLCNYLEKNLNKPEIENYINTKNETGFTVLHFASFRGKIPIISRLIHLHADLYTKNEKGLTILHLAAQGNQPNSLAYFKEKFSLDLNQLDNVKSTPLHWACYTGSLKAVEYLLCNDVELDKTDNEGVTALHLACMSDNIHIVKRLLRAGANRNIKDKNNRTAGELAEIKKKKCAGLFKNKKRICCSCIVIKTPTKKIKKSRKNIYLFLVLYVFSIITEVFFVMDYKEKKINFYMFVVSNSIVFLIYFFLICINTQINKPKKNILELLEEGKDISEYCYKCKIKKEKNTVHCFICQQCIEDFDHHCYWINKCVGKKNYFLFIFFLIFNLINFGIYIYNDLYRIIHNKKIIKSFSFDLMFLVINFLIIIFFALLIIILLIINIRNCCYNYKINKKIIDNKFSQTASSNKLIESEA